MPAKGGNGLLAQAPRRRTEMAAADDRSILGRFKVRIIYIMLNMIIGGLIDHLIDDYGDVPL